MAHQQQLPRRRFGGQLRDEGRLVVGQGGGGTVGGPVPLSQQPQLAQGQQAVGIGPVERFPQDAGLEVATTLLLAAAQRLSSGLGFSAGAVPRL